MTVTDQTPVTDEVFAQAANPPGPTARPFSVEGLVADTNGQPAPMQPVNIGDPTREVGAPIHVDSPTREIAAPSLDPQPSAPPPAPSPPPQPAPEPEVEPDPLAPVDTDQVFGEQPDAPANDIGAALALLGDSNVAEQDLDLIAQEPWEYETIEFLGDTLHVRKPTDQALAGWSLASSRYVKMTTKNDISGLFIARHLSPATYDHVYGRLMNPDDTEYNAETIGKLMAAVVSTRGDADA